MSFSGKMISGMKNEVNRNLNSEEKESSQNGIKIIDATLLTDGFSLKALYGSILNCN